MRKRIAIASVAAVAAFSVAAAPAWGPHARKAGPTCDAKCAKDAKGKGKGKGHGPRVFYPHAR